MKRLSWKYMAGLIDGEGCLDMQGTIYKQHNGLYYNTPRLRLTLAGDRSLSLINLMHMNFGGCVYKRDKGEKWLPTYTWQINGKHLRAFLQNVVNHLHLKKEQAKFVIWWLDNLGGKQTPENVRLCATDEMKAMKRDPQRLSERAVCKLEAMLLPPIWSKYSEKCLGCGTTTQKHNSRGYCQHCYNTIGRKMHTDAIVQPIQEAIQ